LKHWPLFLAILAVVGAAAWYDLDPRFPVKQGLDLKGGMRVILEVDKDKLPHNIQLDSDTIRSVRQILADRVNAFGISGATVQSKGSDQFVVEIPASPPQLVNTAISADHTTLKPGVTTIGSRGTDLVLKGKDIPAKAATIDFEGAIVTVTANAPGVQVEGEPLPVGQPKKLTNDDKLQIGSNTVYSLTLPADAQSTLGALQRTALMEFRWFKDVQNEKNPTAKYRMEVIPGKAGEPDTYKFSDTLTKKPADTQAVINDSELIVSGRDLQPNGAKQDFNTTKNAIVVDFSFNRDGADKFSQFTTNHVGDILAIVLDNVVISAPRIDEPITEGTVQISGGFKDVKEARLLAQLLNAGALPVPLKPAQTQIVGATLGQDSVTRSINAGIAGLVAVLLFMLIYYRLPGVLADIALIFYASLTFALFKILGVVLDLPGITGFILSVGMAVDANILIFERLKEEMKSGKTLHAAIDAGFSRAFSSIFDSNMTTWIVCWVLYTFGTNLIRGFALTLAIGVAVSMFTAITVTRTMLHLVVNFPWARNETLFGLNMSWLSRRFGEGRYIDVFGARRIYFGFSLTLMAVGLGFLIAGVVKPGTTLKPGIDFTGGSVVQLKPTTAVPLQQVRTALANAGFPDATPLYVTDAKWKQILTIRTPATDPTVLHNIQAAVEKLGGGMEHLSTDAIGPTIAKEVTQNAFISVIIASILIIVYLTVRFSFGGFWSGLKYGVCAVIAQLHDTITVVGLFALLGYLRDWHVDSLFVTAVLTVIGFSVHDTIVVYDRIRENLRHRERGETFEHLMNRSVTQTFDRSLNTSFTVILVLAMLLAFGGSVTSLFNWALLIGIVIGTYSSIFVASPLVVIWERLAGAKVAERRTAAAGDVRLRSTPSRPPSPRAATPRVAGTVAAGTRVASRSTAPAEPAAVGGESGGDGDGRTPAGTAAGRQQIKPKRKRRM
jgi:SecD/SecF fusion protein